MTDDTPATAAVRAALETAHWYSADRTGRATLCRGAQDAHDNSACNARDWPAIAPHRAMQLIDAAPVSALLAERDRLAAEVAGLREIVESVDCKEFSGIICRDVRGVNWFDARDIARTATASEAKP